MTETGLSLGTPHYMSPEQATAEKELTNRSDIYSLGSVLYEMLTGSPPHVGSSAQQIIMKIVTDTARPVTELRKSVPPNVAAAVAKALEKLPADRFESAKSFADALANPAFTVAGTAGQAGGVAIDARWRRRFMVMAALAAGFGLLAVASLLRRAAPAASPQGLLRFPLVAGDSLRPNTQSTVPFAVSPDGRTIVFGADAPGTPYQLWIRTLDAPAARRIENTENGTQPAISPDGEWLAFLTGDRMIRKVRLTGGPATDVGSLSGASAALTWMSDDTLLAEILDAKGINRVSAGGGTPVEAIPIDTAANEVRQRRPFVLRRDRMLFYASRTADDRETLVMVSLADGRRARLLVEGVQALGLVDGHLIYTRADGNLMAVPLDVGAMRLTGAPMELADRVVSFAFGTKVALAEGGGGTLVSVPRSARSGRLLLVDTLGRSRSIGDIARGYRWPRFSPDGRHVAVAVSTGEVGPVAKSDLWLIERASGEAIQLTRGANVSRPAWTPDGKRVIYIATTSRGGEVWSLALDGSSPAGRLVDLGGSAVSAVAAPDGHTLFALRRLEGRRFDLVRVRLDQPPGASPKVEVVSSDLERPDLLRISPDGRWLAYMGQWWTAHFRSAEAANKIEYTEEAWGPTWSGDPRRLYLSLSNSWATAELRTAPTLSLTGRRLVGPFPFLTDDFDVSPDGAAFVVAPEGESNEILVTVGWSDELRRTLRRRETR